MRFWVLACATVVATVVTTVVTLVVPLVSAPFSTAHAADAPRRITLDVKHADIQNVIRALAEQGGVNVVIADGIEGKVTVQLRRVTWQRALDAILRTRGLAATRTGDILLIDRLENVLRATQREALAKQSAEKAAQLVTVILPISHANAKDLEPILTAMLSARGTISVDERTNTIIVTDVASSLGRLGSLF